MTRRFRPASSTTAGSLVPLRQRLPSLLFLFAATALIVVGKIDASVIENLRRPASDALAPVMSILSQPVRSANRLITKAGNLMAVYEQNALLREENERLQRWQGVAYALETENRRLRSLLSFPAEAPAKSVAARVVVDNSGVFLRSVLVNAGRRDGVRKGQAAVVSDGLAGRVIESGEWSSRVLLLTDLNSRIPIVLQESGHHGILAGSNDALPHLAHLPRDIEVSVGSRIVTSGSGGLLPSGLPVGRVVAIDDDRVSVKPLADLSRLFEVRLLGFPGDAAQRREQHSRLINDDSKS